MKVVILNSGKGSRLGNLTANNPKCLVSLGTETILERQLRLLRKNDLKEIIITTGPFEEKVRNFCKESFPDLSFQYIHNKIFESTNYIYSLYLVGLLEDDVLLMHGDLVFTEEILSELVACEGSCAFINKYNKVISEKDFKALVRGGRVNKISTQLSGKDVYDFMPMYKLKNKDFCRWVEEIKGFVESNNISVYAEDALNNILKNIFLSPINYQGKLLMEVDDKDDLERARTLIK